MAGAADLKAWNTGHPGGIATIHANSARATLYRPEQLVQESVVDGLTDHLTGTAANQGNTFSTSTPKHNTTLWVKYTFPESDILEGFSLGVGMKNVSSFYFMDSAGTRWIQNGYTVFDAMAGYAFTENLEASLNVTNLFDTTYYEKIGGSNRQNYYGAPRGAMLTLRAKF